MPQTNHRILGGEVQLYCRGDSGFWWKGLTPTPPYDFAAALLPLLCGVNVGVVCFRAVSSTAVSRAVLSLVTASRFALLLV